MVLSIATLWALETSAQSQSLFGNRGPVSQRGSAAGNSSRGGSSVGRTSQAGTGFGGRSGIGGLARGTDLGATGGMAGNGFVGRNGDPGNFVGRRTAGQQNVQTTRRGQNGRNRGNFQNTENARNSGARTRLTRRRIRPLQRIAFSHPVRTDSSIKLSVRKRFESLSGRYPGLRSINAVLAEAGQLTLQGEVDTVEMKRLAEAIIRLEPGVRVVRNELLVAKSDSSN